MKTKLTIIVIGILAIVVGFAIFFIFQCMDDWCFALQQSVENFLKFFSIYAPCERPITYTLGLFDDKFGLSKQAFLNAIEEAEAIWEKPIGKELFAYREFGRLKINLIYDYRQQATGKLESLGIVVKEDKSSYDELKEKYDALNAEYIQAKADYDTRAALFARRKNSYDQGVQYWNKKGGIPKKDYENFQEEKTILQTELVEIQKLEATINEYIDDINALAIALNRLATSLNLNVGKYNEIGVSRGEEFIEGDYQSSGGGWKINIYEFNSHDVLVRVLAHEFGHALGIEHVEDPEAIMYKLNMSKLDMSKLDMSKLDMSKLDMSKLDMSKLDMSINEKLTNDDLEELKARCAIK